MSRSQRALIVEDRPEWQKIFSSTLETIGWEAHVATHYDEAMGLLRDTSFNVAIVDPMLELSSPSQPDGLQLLLDLNDQYPNLPIIVVSASPVLEELRGVPNLPPHLPLLEKEKWDKEAFKGLVLQSIIDPSDSVGRKTVVRMLRAALMDKPTAPHMPALPETTERVGLPRVLIVEDVADWQAILANAVEEQGWFWRVVPNATAALQVVREQGVMFHAILLDYPLNDAAAQREIQPLVEYVSKSLRRTRIFVISDQDNRGEIIKRFAQYPLGGFVGKTNFQKNELLEIIYKFTLRPHLRINTLGIFQIIRDGETIDDFGSAAVEALLKVLISQRGESVPTLRLYDYLFSDHGDTDASSKVAAVRAVVDTARSILQPDLTRSEDSAFILLENAGYLMDVSQNVDLDFEQVEQMLVKGKNYQLAGDLKQAISIYEQASRLYSGEYLPADRQAQWTVALRNHMQTQIARVLNRLADLYAKQGDFEHAIATAQICLRHDSYHESTHRRLMRYHTCNGNRDAALIVYMTLEKLFREFFSESPSPETIALRDAIAAGENVPCIEQPVD